MISCTKLIPAGRLEVICGSMFSGKSEELIRRLRRAEFAHLNIQVFKHRFDERAGTTHVHAHSGSTIAALPVMHSQEIARALLPATEVIGIDEIQFFDAEIIAYIMDLINEHKRIIVAGLDVDFRTVPFGCMPALMALADEVVKLKAVCMVCGQDAQLTQRLVNGKPAHIHDPLVLIGANECYQARCRTCYQLER